MKLHLGCGDVYLRGWINADMLLPGYTYSARARPDLVRRNLASLSHYYKRPYYKGGPVLDLEAAVDLWCDAAALPFPDNSVERILAVQLLEHVPRPVVPAILKEWHRALMPSGYLTVDVPDIAGLCRCLASSAGRARAEEYWIRMIYGSQKNRLAFHYDGYTICKLHDLLTEAGFDEIIRQRNPFRHPYPSITLHAQKPKARRKPA